MNFGRINFNSNPLKGALFIPSILVDSGLPKSTEKILNRKFPGPDQKLCLAAGLNYSLILFVYFLPRGIAKKTTIMHRPIRNASE